MRRWWLNVWLLVVKELHSLRRDKVMMFLITFAFSVAIVVVAHGVKAEVSNASVAMIDNDRSELSRALRQAIRRPYFQPPVDVAPADVARRMDSGHYIFVIEIPPRFQSDLLAGRQPTVQLLVDATAMTQAGLGASYLQQIFTQEVLNFLNARGMAGSLPFRVQPRILYNPNALSPWYMSVMQNVMNVTVLSIILVGAAVIREREHGTIEHLLVMPVRASQIAFAKILANGFVILVAAMLSLVVVVHLLMGVPIAGSLLLFGFALFLYLFSATSLGMWMATMTSSMPQFGMFAVPVYVTLYMLSGAATPLESMPGLVQTVATALPSTQFVILAKAVLYRNADVRIVLPQLAIIAAWGAFFMTLAISRFRQMLARQG